ncbi:hypothetical protein BDB01DRAFT_857158 [Pilobolus umbonatus]|nr:hypothetical protein BDB01DRAFT_857158 [Pilobolus umbonatus]
MRNNNQLENKINEMASNMVLILDTVQALQSTVVALQNTVHDLKSTMQDRFPDPPSSNSSEDIDSQATFDKEVTKFIFNMNRFGSRAFVSVSSLAREMHRDLGRDVGKNPSPKTRFIALIYGLAADKGEEMDKDAAAVIYQEMLNMVKVIRSRINANPFITTDNWSRIPSDYKKFYRLQLETMANKKGIQLYRCIDQWGADVLLKENTKHTTDGKKKKSNKGKQKEGNVKESTDDIVMNDNFFDDEFENFSSYEFDHNDYESDSNADNVLSHQDVSFSDSFRGHDPISSIPYANVPGSSAPYGLVSSSGSVYIQQTRKYLFNHGIDAVSSGVVRLTGVCVIRDQLIKKITDEAVLFKVLQDNASVTPTMSNNSIVSKNKHLINKNDLPIFNIDPLLELSNKAKRLASGAESKFDIFVRSFESDLSGR